MALAEQINGVTKMRPSTELNAIYYHFSKGLVIVYTDRELIEVCPTEASVSPYKIDFNSLSEADKEGATTAEELTDYYAASGFFFDLDTPDIKYISRADQLPPPDQGNVIDLGDDGIKYVFTRIVDLQGAIIDFGNNIITGSSQELGGLANCHISIDQTCTLKFIRFNNVTMTIDAPAGAFDWQFVNFYNSQDIEFKNFLNFTAATVGFINTHTVSLSGSFSAFVLSPNCIWRSVTTQNVPFFIIKSTAVIDRRIRIEQTAFITSFANQTPIQVEPGATIPTEGFRMSNVDLSGEGQITGINGDDDRTLFSKCSGSNIINSTAVAAMYLKENLTDTALPVVGNPFQVEGITTVSNNIQRFEHTNRNSLRYTSKVSRNITALLSPTVFGANNAKIGYYIAIARADENGVVANLIPINDVISESEIYVTGNGTRAESGATSIAPVMVNFGDEIYICLENETNTQPARMEIANLNISPTSL